MKKAFLAAALAVLSLTPGCLGPDHLYNSVKNWNADLSDQDWLNELVFIGLYIIPVYPIALLGDVVVFNTIDYWTAKDTIKDPGPMPEFKRGD
jgi:hypothetical protein